MQQHLAQTFLLEYAPGFPHVDLPTKHLGENRPILEA
jgi:hypothetical protein